VVALFSFMPAHAHTTYALFAGGRRTCLRCRRTRRGRNEGAARQGGGEHARQRRAARLPRTNGKTYLPWREEQHANSAERRGRRCLQRLPLCACLLPPLPLLYRSNIFFLAGWRCAALWYQC